MIIILISGCGKDITNETFSCDKSTNQWANDNYSTLSKMNRNDLIKLKGENQIAAFRTLSPEVKSETVKQKMAEILLLKWDKKEYTHLLLLSDNIKPEWYEANTIDNKFYKMALQSWIKDWTFYCKDSLGWTRDLVFSIGCRFDSPISSNGYLLETQIVDGPPADTKKGCKCSTDDDWCSGLNRCNTGNCVETSGCGLFWVYNCDGTCGDISTR